MRTLSTRRLSQVPVLLAFLILGSWARTGSAQQLVPVGGALLTPSEAANVKPPAPVISTPNYGVSAPTSYTVGACEAGARDDSVTFSAANCVMVVPVTTVTQTDIGFPVHLPTGALITAVTVNYFDNLTDSNPGLGLFRISPTGELGSVLDTPAPNLDGGNVTFTTLAPGPIQVDNSYAYVMLAILHRQDPVLFEGIYSCEIHYMLQVSPAPLTATFTDVPTDNPFFRYVEALAASGITSGCGAGIFCPNNPVTRGQMAVFLSKALGLYFPE